MRLYVDTNIYLDLFLERKGKYLDFAEQAQRLFTRAKGCEFTILFSSLVVSELSRHVPLAVIRDLHLFLGHKAVAVPMVASDADALHIAIATRSADCIVTRNLKDFMDAPIPVFLPESL